MSVFVFYLSMRKVSTPWRWGFLRLSTEGRTLADCRDFEKGEREYVFTPGGSQPTAPFVLQDDVWLTAAFCKQIDVNGHTILLLEENPAFEKRIMSERGGNNKYELLVAVTLRRYIQLSLPTDAARAAKRLARLNFPFFVRALLSIALDTCVPHPALPFLAWMHMATSMPAVSRERTFLRRISKKQWRPTVSHLDGCIAIVCELASIGAVYHIPKEPTSIRPPTLESVCNQFPESETRAFLAAAILCCPNYSKRCYSLFSLQQRKARKSPLKKFQQYYCQVSAPSLNWTSTDSELLVIPEDAFTPDTCDIVEHVCKRHPRVSREEVVSLLRTLFERHSSEFEAAVDEGVWREVRSTVKRYQQRRAREYSSDSSESAECMYGCF